MRILSEYLYTESRHVYKMLRQLGFPATRAGRLSAFSLQEYKGYFRDSGLRLMLYRQHRDPADIFSECYFGANFLDPQVQCVVDVGSHKGDFSLACYSLLKPNSIYCYEPNADLLPALQAASRKMPQTRVTLRNVAVGAEGGSLRYRKTENGLLNSALDFNEAERGLLQAYDSPLIEDSTVEQVTLDEDLAQVPAIDYLKIDTQGFEISVLKGARKTLAKTRMIMIESNFLSIYAGGSTFAEVHQHLEAAGFLLVQLDAPSRSKGMYVWTDALYVSRALIDGK